mgnify:CR=1 FL=1
MYNFVLYWVKTYIVFIDYALLIIMVHRRQEQFTELLLSDYDWDILVIITRPLSAVEAI